MRAEEMTSHREAPLKIVTECTCTSRDTAPGKACSKCNQVDTPVLLPSPTTGVVEHRRRAPRGAVESNGHWQCIEDAATMNKCLKIFKVLSSSFSWHIGRPSFLL